jgi:outer membrane biosynthesis protein TonB
MKKTLFISAVTLILVVASLGWWLTLRSEPVEPVVQSAPSRPATEQALVDSVFESPEQFEAVAVVAEDPAPVLSEQEATPRPKLLSEVKKPQPSARPEPVDITTLHFWKEYASVRTPAIRDPDSAENRAGIISLMKARQQRLGQMD